MQCFFLVDLKCIYVQLEPQIFGISPHWFMHFIDLILNSILCKLKTLYSAYDAWHQALKLANHEHSFSFWPHCFGETSLDSLWVLSVKTTHVMGFHSALTSLRLSPVPGLPATAALAQLFKPHGFVALQSVRQRQKDSVNVLFLRRVLGRRLKQREIVAVGEALGSWGGHLPAVPQVTLVAHHDTRHHGPHRVPAALVNPLWDALEGREARHIVHEDDGVDAAVVVLHHASPETLLTRCVPDLQLIEQKHPMAWSNYYYRL